MGRRPPCCDKSHVKKGPWTAEEDAKILAYVASHGIGNWTLVPQKAGLNRCGKSCRLRWTNYLRPDLKHDSFTPQEEELILMYHEAVGPRWSLIAKQLPGRTDNDVKNHWNTKLKKKLIKMGIDPITHKPYSQLLSDYGNISEVLARNTSNRPKNMNVPDISMSRNTNQQHHEPSQFSDADNNLITMDQFQDYTPLNLISTNYTNNMAARFQVLNEAASSSTSSTPSPCSVAQASEVQVSLPSSPSIWSDYLVGDQEKEHTNESHQSIISSKSCQKCHSNSVDVGRSKGVGVDQKRNCLEGNAAATVSFVEAILNQDREMQLDFPQLLDGCYEY